MKKKLILPIVILLLLVLIGGGIFFLRSGKSSGTATAKAPELTALILPVSDVRLYLAHSDFTVGEEGTLDVTVIPAEELTDDITIVDENGAELLTIANDGSEKYTAAIPVLENDIRYGELFAKCGDKTSPAVSFYVLPEVTDDMILTLADVTDDMTAFIESKHYDNAYSKEALEEIADYLRADSRIACVEPSEDEILYVTKDHMTGSFQRPADEGYAGFSEPTDTFAKSLKGESVADAFIRTEKVRTNPNAIVTAPIISDAGISYAANEFSPTLRRYTSSVNGHTNLFIDTTAADMIHDTSFLNYGYWALITHGLHAKREDDSERLFIQYRELSSETDFRAAELIGLESGDPSIEIICKHSYWSQYVSEDKISKKARIIYTVIQQDDGSFKYLFRISTDFLANLIGDKVFDNTIIFMMVCYGGIDNTFNQFCFDHGASLLIGSNTTMQWSDGVNANAEIVNLLVENASKINEEPITYDDIQTAGNNGEAITAAELEEARDSFANFSEDEINTVFESNLGRINSTLNENADTSVSVRRKRDLLRRLYQNMLDTNLTQAFSYHMNSSNRVPVGKGNAVGKVVNYDEQPEQGVDLEVYYWQDHSFRDKQELVTQSDGSYELSAVHYGLYGILSSYKEERFDYFTTEFSEPDQELPEIIAPLVTVKGRVVDKETKDGISGATVSLKKFGQDIITDEAYEKDYCVTADASGYYEIRILEGEYDIWAAAEDYSTSAPKHNTVLAANGSEYTEADIELEKNEGPNMYVASNIMEYNGSVYHLVAPSDRPGYYYGYSDDYQNMIALNYLQTPQYDNVYAFTIYKDRVYYFTGTSEFGDTGLFSCKLDGSDLVTYIAPREHWWGEDKSVDNLVIKDDRLYFKESGIEYFDLATGERKSDGQPDDALLKNLSHYSSYDVTFGKARYYTVSDGSPYRFISIHRVVDDNDETLVNAASYNLRLENVTSDAIYYTDGDNLKRYDLATGNVTISCQRMAVGGGVLPW